MADNVLQFDNVKLRQYGDFLFVAREVNNDEELKLQKLSKNLEKFESDNDFPVYVFIFDVATFDQRKIHLNSIEMKFLRDADCYVMYFETDRKLALYKASAYANNKNHIISKLSGYHNTDLAKNGIIIQNSIAEDNTGIDYVLEFSNAMLVAIRNILIMPKSRDSFFAAYGSVIFFIVVLVSCLWLFRLKRKSQNFVSYAFPTCRLGGRLGSSCGAMVFSSEFKLHACSNKFRD